MSTDIEETTTPDHSARGERALVITREGGGTRAIIALSAHLGEDLALDGDAPIYSARPGAVFSNMELARALAVLLAVLLARPHESTLLTAPEPRERPDPPPCAQ